jgi:hypothetical protein
MLTAALSHLTDVVQGLQSQMTHVQAQLAASPPTPVPQGVPPEVHASHAASTDQVTGKLKLPQPKPLRDTEQPGAVEKFIFDCEQYFLGMHVPDDRRVFFASGLLDGVYKTWWRHACTIAQQSGTLEALFEWDAFRRELLARFTVVNASRHARDKLANLKQDGSVRSYAQKMQELFLQVPGMQDDELMDRFIRGLKSWTRMEVTMREPRSFDEAVKLADRYDSLFAPGFGFSRQPSGYSSRALPAATVPNPPLLPAPTPMDIDAIRRKPSPLTPEERNRLMKTGGCFYCRQPGHVLTNCPSKPPLQKPRVNNVELPVAEAEGPGSIDRDYEPRDSENSMPQ